MQHTLEPAIRDPHAAFGRGVIDRYLPLCADDFIFNVHGSRGVSCTCRGKDGLSELARKAMASTAGTFTEEVEDVPANDHRSLVPARTASRVTGIPEIIDSARVRDSTRKLAREQRTRNKECSVSPRPIAPAIQKELEGQLDPPGSGQTHRRCRARQRAGPGSRNLDFSVFKSFRTSETTSLQFRAEAFNLTNTPTFILPSARSAALTIGNPNFGKLAGSGSVGRQLQFGLKFLF